MHLQADLVFNQNKIKQLNEKFDVDMYHTKISCGKSFAAEQKIREFKKILLRSQRFENMKKKKKKKKKKNKKKKKKKKNKTKRKNNTAKNMNETVSLKYDLPPKVIEEKSLDPNNTKYFGEVYDFARLKKG